MVVHFQKFPASETVVPTAAPSSKPVHAALSSTGSRRGVYAGFAKRALDVTFIILALPVALPLLVLMALLAALDGASPFYLQKRVGRGGRIFQMLKIRTMVPDADALLESYLESNPAARQEWEETQKLKADPRITRFGRFLRKTSLDELPQLWNVLIGEMSIVGPRPMMLDQQVLYPGRAYYRLRPGITGPWQVSDRNHGTFAGRAKFDSDYEANLSLATDLSILVRTVSVVIRRTGY